jgi:tetratricopeptide (TPR) repeat protein
VSSSSDWSRVRPLLERLLELPEREQAAYLEEACGGDASLRQRLMRMVEDERSDGAFLETPVFGAPPLAGDQGGGSGAGGEPTHLAPGVVLGPWKLVEPLGAGGMGTVWLAERADQQFEKRVALKLLRLGLDRDEDRRRFQQERQVLARLEHPNIARLLDGGATNSGSPWLAMEHVEGVPLVEHARERGLSRAARVDLFLKVCDAVSAAHGALVVHRDLKPSNILVTDAGEPKLLDFGIAKLLDGDQGAGSDLTRGGSPPLTPRYASPEQVRGDPVSTATDVYSLGVILAELLPDADGDLATILAMARREEPGRRYPSVDSLAEDLRRERDGLPVRARADTLGYRARRFLTRHRWAVAAGVVVIASLLAATVVSWDFALEAGAQAAAATSASNAEAEQRARVTALVAELMEVNNRYVADYTQALQTIPGTTAVRLDMARRAVTQLDELSATAPDDDEVLASLAGAYVTLGDLLGNPRHLNVGDVSGARDCYAKAGALEQSLPEAHVERAALRRRLLEREGDLAGLERDTGAALSAYTALRDELAEQLAATPDDVEAMRELARAWGLLGSAHGMSGQEEDAQRCMLEALDLCEKVLAARPGERRARFDLSNAHAKLGASLGALGHQEQSVGAYRASVEVLEQLLQDEPEDALARRSLIEACCALGTFCLNLRDRDPAWVDTADAYLDRGVAEVLAAYDQDPDDVRLTLLLGSLSLEKARLVEHVAWKRHGQQDDSALALYEEALGWAERGTALLQEQRDQGRLPSAFQALLQSGHQRRQRIDRALDGQGPVGGG